MSPFWDFLKRAYEDAYDLPNFYLGIEDELYCHVFTIFFLIALFLGIAYLIQLIIGLKKSGEDDKERKKRVEKSIMGMLEEKDKNKKEKNI